MSTETELLWIDNAMKFITENAQEWADMQTKHQTCAYSNDHNSMQIELSSDVFHVGSCIHWYWVCK